MDVRNCPKCGRPMAFLPAHNRYFCNFCLIPVEADGNRPAPQAGTELPSEIPPELASSMPATPPSEATLYVATSDPKPIVRRSSLKRGTIDALADSETRQAVQAGDYIILSRPGRCAFVAARKAFGEAPIEPLALDMAGEPWRIRISTSGAKIEVGLFKPRPSAPSRMAPPGAAPPEEFHIAYFSMSGQPARLAAYVLALMELLGEPPWSSRFWNGLSRALNQPSSKLMLDWKQYLDYAGARLAVADVAAVQDAFRAAQREGILSPEAENAIGRARSSLAQGEWETARAIARKVNDELASARSERERTGRAAEKVKLAVELLRKLEPQSREAAQLDEQLSATTSGSQMAPAQSRDRVEALLQRAGKLLFALHAARANALLSGIHDEEEALVGEIRECLENELASGRKQLEEGDIGPGSETLENAVRSASERIDEFLKETATSRASELSELYGGSKDNPALSPDFRSRIERGLRDIDAHMQGGKNLEAGQLARTLREEMEQRLESSAPEIRITITGPALTAGSWNKVVMNIQNSGNADAAAVVVAIDGPVELRAQDELPLLRANETYKDEIGIKCDETGSIPVKLLVDCERPHDSAPFHFEAELWLEFQKPLDLSGARTITIDRSVHIVDSVLNRSAVGGGEDSPGLPAVPEGVERVEDGKVVIQDSIINRSGADQARPAAVERKCPTCGRMVSTEWKRCPYCA